MDIGSSLSEFYVPNTVVEGPPVAAEVKQPRGSQIKNSMAIPLALRISRFCAFALPSSGPFFARSYGAPDSLV